MSDPLPREATPRRALVVRSGARAFLSAVDPPAIEVVEVSSHSIEPVIAAGGSLDRPARLAIFTSRIAVDRLFADPILSGRFRVALEKGRIAAVGPATEEELRRHGITVDFVSEGSGEDVLGLLPRDLSGWRVILPRGDDATSELPEELYRRGASVEPLLLYRKIPRPADRALQNRIGQRAFRVFFPTSPSAARWLFAGLPASVGEILRGIPAVVLGRFTRRFLEALGIERVAVTPQPTFAAAARLIELLADEEPGA